jgi:uncharacterized protein YdhG (YjbR/CyaY superfamily)
MQLLQTYSALIYNQLVRLFINATTTTTTIMVKPIDADSYIANFPQELRQRMEQIRATIRENAPGAKEVISYGMPGYKLNGMLVWFAGYANHIGFYPTGSGITAFKDRLSGFKWSKGAVQFPNDESLPLDLVADIVKFKVDEDQQKARKKKK